MLGEIFEYDKVAQWFAHRFPGHERITIEKSKYCDYIYIVKMDNETDGKLVVLNHENKIIKITPLLEEL